MKTKWDIVDDVVYSGSRDSGQTSSVRKAKLSLRKAVTTSVFAGTLLVPLSAVTNQVIISQPEVRASNSKQTDFMEMQSDFVRPQGKRTLSNDSNVDTAVGMSTHRLGELHTKLFRPADVEEVELDGEYSFL